MGRSFFFYLGLLKVKGKNKKLSETVYIRNMYYMVIDFGLLFYFINGFLG